MEFNDSHLYSCTQGQAGPFQGQREEDELDRSSTMSHDRGGLTCGILGAEHLCCTNT